MNFCLKYLYLVLTLSFCSFPCFSSDPESNDGSTGIQVTHSSISKKIDALISQVSKNLVKGHKPNDEYLKYLKGLSIEAGATEYVLTQKAGHAASLIILDNFVLRDFFREHLVRYREIVSELLLTLKNQRHINTIIGHAVRLEVSGLESGVFYEGDTSAAHYYVSVILENCAANKKEGLCAFSGNAALLLGPSSDLVTLCDQYKGKLEDIEVRKVNQLNRYVKEALEDPRIIILPENVNLLASFIIIEAFSHKKPIPSKIKMYHLPEYLRMLNLMVECNEQILAIEKMKSIIYILYEHDHGRVKASSVDIKNVRMQADQLLKALEFILINGSLSYQEACNMVKKTRFFSK